MSINPSGLSIIGLSSISNWSWAILLSKAARNWGLSWSITTPMVGSSIPNAGVRGRVGIIGSRGGCGSSSPSYDENGRGPFFPFAIFNLDGGSVKLSLKSWKLQSLPCESPGVGTKSGGHIVDGQTKMGSFGKYRQVPLLLYRDGKNGISTPFLNAEKHWKKSEIWTRKKSISTNTGFIKIFFAIRIQRIFLSKIAHFKIFWHIHSLKYFGSRESRMRNCHLWRQIVA